MNRVSIIARSCFAVTFAGILGLVSLPAVADGMSNPDEARALCEKRGQAATPDALKACCSNLILVGDYKKQKQLEAQCARPSGPAKAASGAKKP